MIGKVLSFREELQKSASKRKVKPMKMFFCDYWNSYNIPLENEITLRQLLNKYKKIEKPTWVVKDTFKGEYIFKSREYHTHIPCETIYEFCYDNRRGIWINKFLWNDKVVCVQVNGGREGDDACATMLLDKEWLGYYGDIQKDCSIKFCKSLDEEVGEYIRKEIKSYGTPCEAKEWKIREILRIENEENTNNI